MTPLTHLRGPAAPLLRPDINTDLIAPLVRQADGQQPVGPRSREELARRLFGPWRYGPDGAELPDFVLNRAPFRHARFLVAGPNFACGSSRETAATMLEAFGIRCVIAPSFGQIFHDNCFRNGMLPLALDAEIVERLARAAESGEDFALDLAVATLHAPGVGALPIVLPHFRRQMLIEGRDEIEATLARTGAIDAWQARERRIRPWVLAAGREQTDRG